MTFETEELNIEDMENDKYLIFDIAILEWNPKSHCDDPFAIDDPAQELQTNKMTVQDSFSKSYRQDDEKIQIPWDITPMYDNDQGKTIINIMNINTHQEPIYLEENDQEPSIPDLLVQHKAFQICKHQIESSFYNNTYTSQNVSKTKEEIFHDCQETEEIDFHDYK